MSSLSPAHSLDNRSSAIPQIGDHVGVPVRYLNFIPPLLLMGWVFFLSGQENLSTGLGVWDLILRKLAHMGTYALLTLLWWRALAPFTRHSLFAAALISFLYAISDEYHQSFIEGRNGSWIDVGIDTVGIGVALLVSRSDWIRHGWKRR